MKSFQERLYDHYLQVLTINSVLHQSRTEFQEVLIFENRLFGKVLALDGVIQLTERDNHIYHEMIAHVPLLAHGSAERVLIIGGGDGGTLREVLKHPVRTVFLVELDREVIELSRSHLPGISKGAFEDRRATLIVRDATKYVRECRLKFDVIIINSTDPVGPGAQLFSEDFYRDCRGLLRRDGVIAVQSGAPFFQASELAKVCRRLSACFEAALPFLAPVPTYAGASASEQCVARSSIILRRYIGPLSFCRPASRQREERMSCCRPVPWQGTVDRIRLFDRVPAHRRDRQLARGFRKS